MWHVDSLKTLKRESAGRASWMRHVVAWPNRELFAGATASCSDERRLGRAGGRIYSTVGYGDAALALPRLYASVSTARMEDAGVERALNLICDRPLSRDKPPSVTATLLMRGDGKLKCHSRASITRRPQFPSVSFDDRTTDGESHTHSIWLRRVKRVEKPVQPLGWFCRDNEMG
jgi:hypothetical protein